MLSVYQYSMLRSQETECSAQVGPNAGLCREALMGYGKNVLISCIQASNSELR